MLELEGLAVSGVDLCGDGLVYVPNHTRVFRKGQTCQAPDTYHPGFGKNDRQHLERVSDVRKSPHPSLGSGGSQRQQHHTLERNPSSSNHSGIGHTERTMGFYHP
jgi:hypothetical protein